MANNRAGGSRRRLLLRRLAMAKNSDTAWGIYNVFDRRVMIWTIARTRAQAQAILAHAYQELTDTIQNPWPGRASHLLDADQLAVWKRWRKKGFRAVKCRVTWRG